jgi:rubrerythrin
VIGGGAAILAFGGAVARPQAAKAASSDIDILNYALTLEHLEAAFYTQGLMRFSSMDFRQLPMVQGAGNPLRSTVHDYFQLIRDHEVTHVNTLISVIKQLGGTPVAPCRYNFGYKTVRDFVTVAEALEDTGVMAYDGAIAMIENPELQTAGATIATVEARHAAYIRLLNGHVPFPSAFDTPKTMEEILAIANTFIVSC